MRLEFESNVSELPISEAITQDERSEAGLGKAGELLREGIKAAQSGNRSQARHLLLNVTEIDPANESAWLWLASISEYPEELLVFLKNVLEINPDNQRALQWTKATRSLLAKTFVQRGIEATKEDQKEFANQCFNQAVAQDEENEMAWLWMASVSDSDEEKLTFLDKVLSINPENGDAKQAIAVIWENFAEKHLNAAYAAAAQGDRETAHANLDRLLEKLPETEEAWMLKSDLADGPAEKVFLLEKVLSINPENEEAASAIETIHQEDVKKKIQSAHVAAIEGKRENAMELLAEVLNDSPEMEEAWVLKSHLAENFDEKISAFEKVLEINPENLAARASLESLNAIMRSVAPNMPEEPVESALEETVVEGSQTEETYVEEVQFTEETPSEENQFGDGSYTEEVQPAENAAIEEVQFTKEASTEFEFVEGSYAEETTQWAEDALNEETPFPSETSAEETQGIDEELFDVAEDRNPTQELELPEGVLENSPFENEPVSESESYSKFDSAEGSLPEDYTFSEDPWPTEENLDEVVETVDELYPKESEGYSPANLPADEEEPVASFDLSDDLNTDELLNEDQPARFEADSADSYGSAESYVEPVSEAAEEEGHFDAYSGESDPAAETIEFSAAEAFAFESSDEGLASEHEEESYEAPEVEFARPQAEVLVCPFCDEENDPQAYVCTFCSTMLTLSDLEMLLAHPNADRNVLEFAVAKIESRRDTPEFGEHDLRNLGIAHINLKNFEQGFVYLQEAQRINPNDVVLSGQVNALSIRLAEIRQQAEAHDSMVKGKTILVVDDSATVRKLIAGKLEKSGHEVICAVDGVDALEKMEDMVPDLILLDINMPRMDGYQVCKLIRNNRATENVPVVMISGKDGFFDKVRGRMSGTTGYITKPFGPETLMKALETYIVNETVHEDIED